VRVALRVDSSIWIAHLRGHQTLATAKLETVAGQEPLLIGDLILLELLHGARNEDHAARIERGLRRYSLVPLPNAELASRAARNYRTLRGLGVTIRKTADISSAPFASRITASYCMMIMILRRWSNISVLWWRKPRCPAKAYLKA